jgi:hypothetical protein
VPQSSSAKHIHSLTQAAAIKIAANVGRNWKHKVAPPGVGRIQVWINNENKLDRGSKYTDRGLTTFDFGSKKIMALSVSPLFTVADHSPHDNAYRCYFMTPLTNAFGKLLQ